MARYLPKIIQLLAEYPEKLRTMSQKRLLNRKIRIII